MPGPTRRIAHGPPGAGRVRPGSGADPRVHDALEPLARRLLNRAGRVQLGRGRIAVVVGLVAGVGTGAGPLEDRRHIGDVGGRRGWVAVALAQAEPVDRLRLLARGPDPRG